MGLWCAAGMTKRRSQGIKQMHLILRNFVKLNDDLVTTYVRSPTDEVRALSSEERREQLRTERENFGAEALRALEPILGEADAAKVAERVFTNPWGLRQRGFKR